MTISNRMLLTLLAFVAGAVGLSMYVGMRIGLEAAAPAAETTLAMAPAAAAVPETPAATTAAPATVTTDQCAFLLAVESHRSDDAEAEAAAPSEVTIEEGDFATNSGTIDGSQFSDGGFGDIGQQWWGVTVNGNVTNVNVDSGGSANVAVGGGSTTPPAGAPILAETPTAPPMPAVPVDPAPAPEPQAPTPAPTAPAPAPATPPQASTPEVVPAAAPNVPAAT